MKNYLITVNGTTYEVQVEEVDALDASAPVTPKATAVPKVSAPPPASVPAAAPVKKPAASGTMGGVVIKAPMPGSILKINVAVGDTVKNGSVLCILEAMKMENEIVAPQDGVIASINTSQGSMVNPGDVLLSMS